MPIRCLTLDLDNTLWDVTPTMIRAEKETHRWTEQHLPQVALLLGDAEQLMAIRDELIAQHPVLAVDLGQLRRRLYQSLVERSGTPPGQVAEQTGRIFEVHKQWRNRVELYDGVREGLEWLSDRMTLGAITNGNADVSRIGLGEYFDFAISPADTGTAKPDPEIFHAAQRAAGIPVNQIAHMGDSVDIDVEGARGAGFQAIWFNPETLDWPQTSPAPAQIAHWKDLPAALERL